MKDREVSRRRKKEEQILAEVREKVIRESMNIEEEESILHAREAEIEALIEISDLPEERIYTIEREIRKKLGGKKKKKRLPLRKITKTVIGWTIAGLVVAAIVGIPTLVKAHSKAKYETRLAVQEAYRNLSQSAAEGNLQMVKFLISEGVPPDQSDFGYSALNAAVLGSHSDVVEYLLQQGADINWIDSNGRSLVYQADEQTNIAVRRIVAEAFADASPPGHPIRELWTQKISYSPQSFYREIEDGNLTAISLFLQADAGIYAYDWERTGLFHAVETKDLEILTAILKNAEGLDPKWISSVLIASARERSIGMMQVLLDHGADIDYQSGEYEFTALLAAVHFMDVEGIKFLLEQGADPNKRGAENAVSALMMPFQRYSNHLSTDEEKISVMRMLIDHGADINAKDRDGRTVLDYARYHNMSGSIRFIKNMGADITLTEDSFRNVVKENDAVNAGALLAQGIDPDLQEFDYYDETMTGLIYAAGRGYEQVSRVLLEAGADVNHRTGKDRTALWAAFSEEHSDLCRLLLKYGADPSTKIGGNSILFHAVDDGNTEMVEILLDAGAGIERDVLDLIDTNSFAWNSDQREQIRLLFRKRISPGAETASD